MKKILSFIIFFLLSLLIVNAESEAVILPSQVGIVQHVEYIDMPDNEFAQVKQVAEIKLLNKDLKNKIISVDNIITGNPYYDIKLKKNTKVILHAEANDGNIDYSIENIQRSNVLILLSIIFCGLLIYVGRKKGIYSLVSIVLTCLLIYYLLSPMILFGFNPTLATGIICIFSTLITMYLVGGFNRKSSAASLGCLLSLGFAGILAYITTGIAALTGFNSEHTLFLFTAHPELNFVSIAISTIILATLGAVMDIAMSIASTINEIHNVDNTKTVKELFACGMNVGRDIIGTMANTLILVYLGSSLPLLLLASNIDFVKFINLNQVVTEIASALIGSCAIVICVPITAIVASKLMKNIPPKPDFSALKD